MDTYESIWYIKQYHYRYLYACTFVFIKNTFIILNELKTSHYSYLCYSYTVNQKQLQTKHFQKQLQTKHIQKQLQTKHYQKQLQTKHYQKQLQTKHFQKQLQTKHLFSVQL